MGGERGRSGSLPRTNEEKIVSNEQIITLIVAGVVVIVAVAIIYGRSGRG